MSRERTVILLRSSLGSPYLEICEATLKEMGFDVTYASTEAELTSEVERHACVIVLRGVRTVEQLRSELFFVRQYQSWITEGRMVLIALNELVHRQTYMILRKMGFREVISISAFKPEACRPRLMAALEDSAKFAIEVEEFVRNNDETGGVLDWANWKAARDFEAEKGAPLERGRDLELAPPLDLPQNFWLLRRPEDIRIIRGHWVVDLLGPGRSAGSWQRHGDSVVNRQDGHGIWEWRPKDSIPSSLKTGLSGRWIFHGKRPKFYDYHWTFIAKHPRLTFIDGEERPLADYFSLNQDRKFVIAANSAAAIEKWTDIHATLLLKKKFQIPAAVIQDIQFRLRAATDPAAPPAASPPSLWRDMVGLTRDDERQLFEEERRSQADIQLKLAPKPQLFNPIGNPAVRRRYFEELREQPCPVLVWTPRQAIRLEAKIIELRDSPEALVVQPERDLPATGKLPEQLFVSLSFPRGSVFFSLPAGTADCVSPERLILPVPAEIFEVQRRHDFRLEIPDNRGPFLRIGDRFYPIRSLSAGGLAFVAGAEDAPLFEGRHNISDASFELETAMVRCSLEIRWRKIAGPELRIGARFTQLHRNDHERISIYVLEATLDYLQRFVR